MRKKSEFTILERAMQTVPGFDKVYHKMNEQTILGGRSQSTLENYLRRIALICLEYKRLPEEISEEEINEYLTGLAQMAKSPSRSSFKHAVNSCGNRHCPKCQSNRQALWVDDRVCDALDVKYFHVVFTVPEALNQICLLDSKRFYNTLFECVWSVLQTFGYSHYGVESGAICVLHTWGQNLSLHPHIHCIVPAAGLTLKGKLKHISKQGKYLYPVRMLSVVFRGKMLEKIKRQLKLSNQLPQYQTLLDDVWRKPWVVYCEPPLGDAQQIVKYLGQYTHRVAISNHRIQNIDDSGVSFFYKDYKDNSKKKLTKLSGVEFLRRFCQHILPYRFVKIRYYGILSSKQKQQANPLLAKEKSESKQKESNQERIVRITGFDRYQCPFCKTGIMNTVELLPRIRSPTNVLYRTRRLSV